MSFTLTVTTPPKKEGEKPKVTVSDPLPTRDNLHTVAYWAMRAVAPWMHPDEVSRYAWQIVNRPIGVKTTEASTGLCFRVDAKEEEET